MIRIELIDHRGHHIKSMDFSGENFKIGRDLVCDLIVPDLGVAKVEMSINRTAHGDYILSHNDRNEVVKDQSIVHLHRNRIKVTNLKYYAESESKPEPRAAWVKPVVVLAIYLCIIHINEYFLKIRPTRVFESLSVLFFVCVFVIASTAVLSLVSRIVNGDYKFWKISSNVVYFSFFLFLLETDGLSLRFMLPKFFEYNAIWNSFLILACFPIIWNLISLVCESFTRRLKVSLVSAIYFFYFAAAIIPYLPTQKRFRYYSVEVAPAMMDALDKRPIAQDQFLKSLDEQME